MSQLNGAGNNTVTRTSFFFFYNVCLVGKKRAAAIRIKNSCWSERKSDEELQFFRGYLIISSRKVSTLPGNGSHIFPTPKGTFLSRIFFLFVRIWTRFPRRVAFHNGGPLPIIDGVKIHICIYIYIYIWFIYIWYIYIYVIYIYIWYIYIYIFFFFMPYRWVNGFFMTW